MLDSPQRAPRPAITAALARGVCRLLVEFGYAPVLEMTLANGRRADIVALSSSGRVVIVETKSCLEDWRADGKWGEYAGYCDALYVAVPESFPLPEIPAALGLIVADGFGGAFLREPAPQPALPPARRKAITLSLARLAALRLQRASEPATAP